MVANPFQSRASSPAIFRIFLNICNSNETLLISENMCVYASVTGVFGSCGTKDITEVLKM